MNILNMEEWKQENSVNMEPLKEQHMGREMSATHFVKLQETMNRAKAENRRERFRKSMAGYSAAAAALVAAFIILPNTSASVAHAMGQVPLLGQLVSAVTFRDYQYEGERYHADITVPELVVATYEDANAGIAVTDAGNELSQSAGTQSDRISSERTSDAVQEKLTETVSGISAEIKEYTDKLIDQFAKQVQDELGYQDVYVTSEVLTANEEYFTLKVFCYQGAGSGYQWNYFYTINLKTGERMKLADVFAEDADYITPISENIKEQMRRQMAENDKIYYWLDHEIEEWNFKSITADTSFYVNAEGNVVIAFDEGEVGPMSTGSVEFVIPTEVVADIIK